MNNVQGDAGAPAIESLRANLADLVEGLNCAAGAIVLRSGAEVSLPLSLGLSEEAVAAYASFWHRRDPWLAALRGPFAWRACRGEDLVGARLLRGSEFHSGWLVPNRLCSAGIAELMPVDGATLLLCVWRAVGTRPLSKSDTAVLRGFGRTFSAILQQRSANAGAAVAAELVGRSVVPIALAQGDGTLLWANGAAAQLWGPEGPLRRVGGKIGLRHAALAPRFAQLLQSAVEPGARATIAALQTDEGVLPIRVQPLVLSSGERVVALTGGIANGALPGAGTIAAALGLTRAQAEVAALLCRGLETAMIAERLSISPNTLNGHLRELYDRLRVGNRVQAVVRVLAASSSLTLLSPGVANGVPDAPCAPFDAYTPK